MVGISLLPTATRFRWAALVTAFRCHLYDDLMIRQDDIFYDLLGVSPANQGGGSPGSMEDIFNRTF